VGQHGWFLTKKTPNILSEQRPKPGFCAPSIKDAFSPYLFPEALLRKPVGTCGAARLVFDQENTQHPVRAETKAWFLCLFL
jgi:hypothetical protein